MKKDTQKRHSKIANGIMHYIYKHLDTNIDLEDLSSHFGISKFHMLRIFKNEFQQNIYETIKSIRLQKASTLLLLNKNSTITEIANMCGYSSHSAFIRVFKDKFKITPKEWKMGGYKKVIKNYAAMQKFSIEPKITKISLSPVYYIRQKGDLSSKKKVWDKLTTWSLQKEIKNYKKVEFFYDIPALDSINECTYTAGIIPDENIIDDTFPALEVLNKTHAKFDFTGTYEEFLNFVNWVHFSWLINSGYETSHEPSFVIYKNDSFLDTNKTISLSYYLSIFL